MGLALAKQPLMDQFLAGLKQGVAVQDMLAVVLEVLDATRTQVTEGGAGFAAEG